MPVNDDNIVNLPLGDRRAADFADKLEDFIIANAEGLPLPTVLGVLDIVKFWILEGAFNDN